MASTCLAETKALCCRHVGSSTIRIANADSWKMSGTHQQMQVLTSPVNPICYCVVLCNPGYLSFSILSNSSWFSWVLADHTQSYLLFCVIADPTIPNRSWQVLSIQSILIPPSYSGLAASPWVAINLWTPGKYRIWGISSYVSLLLILSEFDLIWGNLFVNS